MRVVDANRHHPENEKTTEVGADESAENCVRIHVGAIGAMPGPIEQTPPIRRRMRSSVYTAQRMPRPRHSLPAVPRTAESWPRGLAGIWAAILSALAAAGIASAQTVEVKVLHFGTGDLVRASGPVAMLVEFRAALDAPVEVEAALELPNADLDIAEYSRSFVLNPGQAQRRWIYGVLPPLGEGTLQSSIFDLRIYERVDGRRVRDLGTVKVAPQVAENIPIVLPPERDAVLVIGSRTLGLETVGPARDGSSSPSMHSTVAIGKAASVDSLPDRWEGYAPFESVIWASANVSPARLADEPARALREWVERGGNLVIVLPSAGDAWAVGALDRHPLSDLLPTAPPTRVEDVRVADLLPMLSLDDRLRDPNARMRLNVFDADALNRPWRPFIAVPARRGPDGAPIVADDSLDGRLVGVRRSLGFGHITLLGIDVEELSSRGLQSPQLPQADVFWNRILGRRADTPSGAEFDRMQREDRLARGGGYSRAIESGPLIARETGLAGQAAVGILAATTIFALYWLVAGPLGFAVLKTWKRERWSWVAYLVVAAIFATGILLVGNSFAGREARIRHLTVLDIVSPPPGPSDRTERERRRAIGWLSLFSPSYGSVEVALDPEGEGGLRNTIDSWRPIGVDAQAFPSRERYQVPLERSGVATAPSRATAIDFTTRWLGAVDPAWGTLPVVAAPIEVSVDRSASPPRISISGELRHGLRGNLVDVQIIHIWPLRNPLPTLIEDGKIESRRLKGQLPNRGVVVSLPVWSAGEALDLGRVLGTRPLGDGVSLQRAIAARYYDDLYAAARNLAPGFGIGNDSLSFGRAFEMLSMYSMLEPPAYLQNPPEDPKVLRIVRQSERELDLGRWFTEPCLIVIGTLADAPLPYPLTVDGETVESSGKVLVRWVVPLPVDLASVTPERVAPARSRGDAIEDGTGAEREETAPLPLGAEEP